MFCMIGGAGSSPANIARRNSMPVIEAISSGGVTPYSILRVVGSVMRSSVGSCDDTHHIKGADKTRTVEISVIARSKCDEAILSCLRLWIASLALAMTDCVYARLFVRIKSAKR